MIHSSHRRMVLTNKEAVRIPVHISTALNPREYHATMAPNVFWIGLGNMGRVSEPIVRTYTLQPF